MRRAHRKCVVMTSMTTQQKVQPLVKMLEASKWSVRVVSSLLSAEDLKKEEVSLLLSHHNGLLLRQEQIDAVGGRCYNVHPSIIPLNRGASPIMWATLRQTFYGVSIHQVNIKIDQGAPISQRALEVDEGLSLARIYELHEFAWYEMLRDLTLKDAWLESPRDLAKSSLVEGRGTYNSRSASERAFRSLSEGWQTIARVAREQYHARYGLES